MSAPTVVVFDVNETLSDMAPLADRFTDVGAPAAAAQLWFTALLRDGFALTAAGGSVPFARLADGALRTVLASLSWTGDADAAVRQVMSGFMALDVHPDVADGVRALRRRGLRLTTLSNGSTEVAERLLTAAGLREEFELLLSVDDAGVWKPAAGAYGYAARTCAVPVDQLLLVAVHPWDIDGAARAGLATAWLNRGGAPYPAYFTTPDHIASTLSDLAGQLG